MPSPTRSDELLALIRRADLLPAAAVSEAGDLPGDAAAAADALVRRGLLTSFQATLLLAGKYKGFAVGPYVIRDRLGAGGMGTVYLAEHRQLRRMAAIKVLSPETGEDRAAVGRFLREARAAAALDHPNIVRVHDVAQHGSVHYLALEYVQGRPLDAVLRSEGPMLPARAADVVAQAASGLQHAHERGFVHRDIKPSNLILARDGTVKVLDMGLARSAAPGDSVTENLDRGAVVGTADYIAPEQALGSGDIDARADIYSLGATFFALVVGRPPFGGTVAQKLLHHQMQMPGRIDDLAEHVPAGMADVAAKMMAKKPEERYQTAAEVVAALAPWLHPSGRHFAGMSATRIGTGPLSGRYVGDASTARLSVETLADVPPPVRRRWKIVAGAALTVAAAATAVGAIAGRPPAAEPTRSEPPPAVVAAVAPPTVPKPVVPPSPPAGEPVLARTLNCPDGALEDVDFSPDGRLVLAAAVNKAVVAWDAATGAPAWRTPLPDGRPRMLALLFGGKEVAVACNGDRVVRMLDAETGRPLRQLDGHDQPVTSVAAMPDGRLATAGRSQPVRFWDASACATVGKVDQSAMVFGLAVTHDGRTVFTGAADKVVRAYDAATGAERNRVGGAAHVWRFGVSPDGTWAGFGSDAELILWNPDSNERRALTGASKGIDGVAFVPGGRVVLAVTADGGLHAWNVIDGKKLFGRVAHGKLARSVAVSPDGRLAATAGADGAVLLWELPASWAGR